MNVDPEAVAAEIERECKAAIRALRSVIANAQAHVAELEQPVESRAAHTGSSLIGRELQQIGVAAAAATRHDALLRVIRGEYSTDIEGDPR